MANTTPPSSIYCGDSYTWTATLTDYSAASYSARVVFSRVGEDPVSIDGTASGTDFAFTIPLGTSQAMEPGKWLWAYRVIATDASESKIAATGSTWFRPDPAAESREKTHNEKCLELCKAAMENRLTDVQESFSVLGQDITKVPAGELERLLDRYQTKVNEERKKLHALRTGARRRRSRVYLGD